MRSRGIWQSPSSRALSESIRFGVLMVHQTARGRSQLNFAARDDFAAHRAPQSKREWH